VNSTAASSLADLRYLAAQPAKTALFASALARGQKPRFLPAADSTTRANSAESAAGDFQPMNYAVSMP
jgi:hypothetical protein